MVNQPEINSDLFQLHFVEGRDVDEEIDGIRGQHLRLMRKQENDVGCRGLGLHLVEAFKTSELKNFLAGENGRQVLLRNVDRGRDVHNNVFAVRKSIDEDVSVPT